MQHTRTFERVHPRTAGRSAYASVPRTARKASPYARLANKIFRRVRKQALAYLIAFYILPAVLSAGFDAVLLTLIYPALCFFLSGMYGVKHGFISHYLAVPLLLFLPASFLFFKPFTALFCLCYLLTSAIALTLGTLYRQLSR